MHSHFYTRSRLSRYLEWAEGRHSKSTYRVSGCYLTEIGGRGRGDFTWINIFVKSIFTLLSRFYKSTLFHAAVLDHMTFKFWMKKRQKNHQNRFNFWTNHAFLMSFKIWNLKKKKKKYWYIFFITKVSNSNRLLEIGNYSKNIDLFEMLFYLKSPLTDK